MASIAGANHACHHLPLFQVFLFNIVYDLDFLSALDAPLLVDVKKVLVLLLRREDVRWLDSPVPFCSHSLPAVSRDIFLHFSLAVAVHELNDASLISRVAKELSKVALGELRSADGHDDALPRPEADVLLWVEDASQKSQYWACQLLVLQLV